MPDFDAHSVRADFPVLWQQVYGKPLVYLYKTREGIDALVAGLYKVLEVFA